MTTIGATSANQEVLTPGEGLFVASYFLNNDTQPYIGVSVDGKSIRGVGKLPSPNLPGNTLRDPRIARIGSTWYIVGTGGGVANGFEFMSGPTLRQITHVAAPTGNVGWQFTWAPSWYFAPNGDVYIVVAASSTGIGGPFSIYTMKATNLATGTFAAPVAVSGPWTTMIDATILLVGSTYHLFGKFEDTVTPANQKIHHYTATALNGTYTEVSPAQIIGDTTGYSEAPWVLPLGGSNYRLYYDVYNKGGRMFYVESTDGMATWGAQQEVASKDPLRHGNVIDMRAVSSVLAESQELLTLSQHSPKPFVASAYLSNRTAVENEVVITGRNTFVDAPTGTTVTVLWNIYEDPYFKTTAVADTWRCWDTSTGQFIAPFDGAFEIMITVGWFPGSGGAWTSTVHYFQLFLVKTADSGVGVGRTFGIVDRGPDMDQKTQTITRTLNLKKGDRVKASVNQDTGVSRSIDGGSGFNNFRTLMEVRWVA
jgi:hypothetical protein